MSSQDRYFVGPNQSQDMGLLVSVLLGLGCILFSTVLYALLDRLWQLGAFIGVVTGSYVGIETYYKGLRSQNWVPLNWIGLGTTNDAPNGVIYAPGTHWMWRWRPRVHGLIPFPGPELYLSIAMPGEAIDAADNVTVLAGLSSKGERTAIQGRIVDIFKYYRTGSEQAFYQVLADAYLDSVRLFINQALYGMGVVNKSYLLKKYLMLTPFDGATEDAPREHVEFLQLLRSATTQVGETARPLYSEEGLAAIQSEAGQFRLKLYNRGFVVDNILLPNLRQNDAVESLAVVGTLSNDLQRKTGVTADIATAITAQAAGIPQHQMMLQVPGIPPALVSFAEKLAA